MKAKIILFVIYIITISLCFHDTAIGYDDLLTHPEITKKAISPTISNLDKYLIDNLGLKDGIKTPFPSSSKNTVRLLLQAGSTDEDTPACRAANHFHDPLKTWNESYMSDDTIGAAWLIRQKCNVDGWNYYNRQSNVTWATGYLSPPPNGQKQTFSSDPYYAPVNWDKAREYYFNALTSTTNLQPPYPHGRDYYFAKTFQSLGNVLHLLEDMAVPAHVRNDFTSHVAFHGMTSPDFLRWFGNHYEYYVQNHTEIISSISNQTIQYPWQFVTTGGFSI